MLNFKGKRGEEVARTLISACLWNDSVESKSRAYGVSPQTVRNYVEEQGVEVVEKLLEHFPIFSRRSCVVPRAPLLRTPESSHRSPVPGLGRPVY